MVGPNKDTSSAMDAKGHMMSLPYSLRLQDFYIETNDADGSPTQYAAELLIDKQPVSIAVNNPHPMGISEDIYLMNFHQQGNDIYCVFMIERQPWKYPMLAGICLLLLGAVAGGIKRVKAHDMNAKMKESRQ